jgi:Rod binding domain-containing protein
MAAAGRPPCSERKVKSMNSIDIGLANYNNQPLRIPGSAKQVQGTGASIAPGSAGIDRKSKLFEQCQEFESIFVKMMVSEMQKSVEKGGLMNGGYAEEIFNGMLQDEYSKTMTKTANFGIADSLYRQLAKQG